MPTKRLACQIEEDLARSIVLGLHWEYGMALPKAPQAIRLRVSARPNIMLTEMTTLGIAEPETWTIRLKYPFAMAHRFDAVRDVFLHEVAHLWTSCYPDGRHEVSHGSIFRAMCELVGADPQATNKNSPLFGAECRNLTDSPDPQDQLRAKVHKLLALAQSPYPEEARSAASKASEVITRHNLTLIEEGRQRSFATRFMCEPAKRHPHYICVVANILQRFFFVEIVWAPAWIVARGCAGSVAEMSGRAHDLEFAAYVFEFIQRTIRAEWDRTRTRHSFSGREFGQFALGVANGFYAKLEEDRRALSERLQAERNSADVDAHSRREHVCSDLMSVADPRLSDYVKRRYGRLHSVGRASPSRKSSYYAGKKVGKNLVLHRGVKGAPTASGRMLPERTK